MTYVTMQDKLQGDYKDAFVRIETYSILEQIDETHREDLMMNLLDLLLSAQEEGKPIEKVIGTDVQKFCDSYFADYLLSGKFYNLLDIFFRAAWFGLILETCFMFSDADGHSNPLSLTSDITGYLTGLGGSLIFSTIFLLFAKPLIFRKGKRHTALIYLLNIAGSIAFGLGLLYLLDEQLPPIPYWLCLSVFGGYIIVFYTARAISRYRDHGSIRKRRDPDEKPFFKDLAQQVDNELPAAMDKRFQRINKRRKRKGKQPMTEQEYFQKIRKEIKISSRYVGPIVIGLLILMLLRMIIRNYMMEGLADTVIFTAVLLICEIPAFAIFRATITGDIRKMEIITHCEEQGISLKEYAEELLQGASEEDPDA